MKIAHVIFVFITLELFFGSNSFKTSDDVEDETLPPSTVLATQRGERGGKVCIGIHTIVSSPSVAANNIQTAERGSLLERQKENITLASSIPRVIHVTFRSIEELPQCVPDTFQKINPNFEIRKWGDKEIIKFLKDDFSQKHADAFESIPDGEIKADLFRLAVIWKLGGWYLDMDVGLKQPLEKFADPNADMIVAGSVGEHRVNPIVFASEPGNAVILNALNKVIALYGKPYDFWSWSVCTNLWLALNEEFDGKFEPSNIAAIKTSPRGFKVQMLQEKFCSFGHGTVAEDLVLDNDHGCQAGLTEMAPHGR